ncbi:lipase member I-like [Planococcus citri]|uniref:lipase member I-like n=1 Tax=Planococcus citri TaxID=170843 RepID=UPI0031F76925
MILHDLKFFCFTCIVFVALQTSHAIQENCPKYNAEKSCKDNEVEFFLRTPGGVSHELNLEDPKTISDANFIQEMPVKFIIHGHRESKDDFLVTPLKLEYFKLNYNVVMINYSKLSNGTCYRTGVDNSLKISECAARMIEGIIDRNSKGIKMDDFHILGLSLGGQMAGQIPNIVDEKYGKFPRITGIDPANDGFFEDYATDKYTLTKEDAKLVDVIHSNAGINGVLPPMGHIDWYPNGGIFQPQCHVPNSNEINAYLCDHMRSLILFLESIGDENFELETEWCPDLESKYLNPDKCEKDIKTPFGENITLQKVRQGVHFFKTRDTPPYIRDYDYKKYPVYTIHLDVEAYFKSIGLG